MPVRARHWVLGHKLATALVVVLIAVVLGAAGLAYLRYHHRSTVAEAGARLETLARSRVFHRLPPGAVLLDDRFEICTDSSDPAVTRTMTVPDTAAAAAFFRDLLVADHWSLEPNPVRGEAVLLAERELHGWDATIVVHATEGQVQLTGSVGNGDYEPGCLR